MAMASRIAVMSQGKVLQVGTPLEIYEQPNCRFVAEFIGNVNLFEGEVSIVGTDHCEVSTRQGRMKARQDINATPGRAVTVAVRPEKIQISKTRPDKVVDNLFQGRVLEIAYFGSYNTFILATGAEHTVKITQTNTLGHEASLVDAICLDDVVFFWWDGSTPMVLGS